MDRRDCSCTIEASAGVGADPHPPPWALDLVRREPERFSIISHTMAGAVALDGPALEKATEAAYLEIGRRLRAQGAGHALRIWNFIPKILAPAGGGQDRYMRFNAGRYHAFVDWFGEADQFGQRLPAASGVGHSGDALVIHLLAGRDPGLGISNPRQCAPHKYSRQFGPLPPCFARATLLQEADRRLLLIGGTASVRGEDSVHHNDLGGQIKETLENLAALIRSARGTAVQEPLSDCRDLRVYYVRDRDLPAIRSAIAGSFPNVSHPEFFRAELCRSDLLVEVEGLASFQ